MLIGIDISKRYGRHEVLNDVSFEVPPASIVGLLGPNGSGKSTLLHIVCGLVPATAGAVYADGHPLGGNAYRQLIGFCPDDLPQADLLTGSEFLDMVRGVRRLRRVPEAEEAMLAGLRLADARSRLIATYSHGMKRKLQLVAALLHNPRILILDEPFRGLDPESSAIMKRLLVTYAARGNAVLISTHDLLVAGQLCTEVMVLRDGAMLTAGTEFQAGPGSGAALESSFLELTGLGRTSEGASSEFFEGLDMLPVAHP